MKMPTLSARGNFVRKGVSFNLVLPRTVSGQWRGNGTIQRRISAPCIQAGRILAQGEKGETEGAEACLNSPLYSFNREGIVVKPKTTVFGAFVKIP
jgi:hypothetical protein